MESVLALLAEHERLVYGLLGLAALACLGLVWLALRRVEITPFGLEKNLARRRLNLALTGVLMCLALAAALYVLNRYITPALDRTPTPLPPELQPTARPTATPIQSAGPLRVDSSTCDRDTVNLSRPAPGERITGEFNVIGTANVPNLAFYKIEVSGAATSGAWVTLIVGNEPKVNGRLGVFNINTYQLLAGEYAFRLVATDNLGMEYPPCAVLVVFAPLDLQAEPATPAP